MKLLFVASNPQDQKTLALEREITEIQRRIGWQSTGTVEFTFLPALAVEDFTTTLLKVRPDVVHLSAHGDNEALRMASASGKSIEITGEILAAMLTVRVRPKLVYVNACNSAAIAKEIAKVVPMAIGSTASIENGAARATAIVFYEGLLSGSTVTEAFHASSALLSALSGGTAQSALFPSGSTDLPATVSLVHLPKIVAKFPEKTNGAIDYSADKFGEFDLDIGLAGCPADTVQIVFFTDDETMSDEDEGWLDNYLESDEERAASYAKIVRGYPVRGRIWCESVWTAAGDFRIFATGSTGTGRTFSAYAMVCDALEAGLRTSEYQKLRSADREGIAAAISKLRENDGS
ncbi:hypothetical protein DSM104443_01106 [Usitatibacter rugosus]|uniref:CHAT domain-containing protein n=1 Tax=Usitatibacter rugosus TaxID=2732067 RepID=A0A6M4GSL1_9PROT|nr:CHAT domain-containing protein [Usitatibacter rugosus]QJR10055.1 hypothetical protein DSM104443_01106 [Usitatibacter rugosus]